MAKDAGKVLDRIYAVIESRRGGDPAVSYVAKRFSQGRGKIAQKLGEESVETVIAALTEGREAMVAESADLLFHLLILWADMGIKPADVLAELESREGISGLDEKRARQDAK
jgi:phosphoribosyl-ATP pyrophosphohydrolase